MKLSSEISAETPISFFLILHVRESNTNVYKLF